MHVAPQGFWVPDEIAVLEAAYGILHKIDHPGLSDAQFETLIVEDLMNSARDGCHDAHDLARRCRAHLKDKARSRLPHG